MPGLIGWIRPADIPAPDAGHALLLDEAGVTVWLAGRAGPAVSAAARLDPVRAVATAGPLTLALHGHVHDPRGGGLLSAAGLLALWRREGEGVLDRLEGAFQLALLDRDAGRFRLVNDRLGVLPLVWRADGPGFAFAPRVADLPGPPVPRRPDPAGVVTFLANGYCLGTRTLVAGTSHLAPAEVVTVTLAGGARDHRRYWDLRYEPDRDVPSSVLARALHEQIASAFALLVPAGGKATGLLLSGGWDCRSLLGAAVATGRPPAAVITNGVSDALPGTDTDMARRLAGLLGLEYRFCRRDPALGARLAPAGIVRCELRADTCPEVFGQHEPPPAVFAGLRAVLKGDEIWGWNGEARSEPQAVGNVMPTRLAPSALVVLAPGLRGEAEDLRRSEIAAVWQGCDAEDWNDRKDYLYLKGRVSRYIFGLGASDEEQLTVLRPFLARNVLDVVRRVPGPLRVQKNLFLEMLARHEPRLYRLGRNHGSHIADYYFHMAPFVRERALARLRDGWDLDGLLDRGAAVRLLEGFAPRERPPAAAPGGPHSIRHAIIDRWGWRWYRTKAYRDRTAREGRDWHFSESAVAFRVWLLSEWLG